MALTMRSMPSAGAPLQTKDRGILFVTKFIIAVDRVGRGKLHMLYIRGNSNAPERKHIYVLRPIVALHMTVCNAEILTMMAEMKRNHGCIVSQSL